MSDESRVMALLEEGNPATDVGDAEWLEITAPAYLATLSTRSEEMTQLKTPERQRSSSKTTTMQWLAAAIAILVIGTTIVILSIGDDESPAATTLGERSPTTMPTPSTVVDPLLEGVPTWTGQGVPGTYQPLFFEVPFVFTMPTTDWVTGTQEPQQWAVCSPNPGSNCFERSAVAVFVLDRGDIEQTQAFLSTFPGAEITGVEETDIGGAEGVRFEFTHDLEASSGIGVPDFGEVPSFTFNVHEVPLGAGRSIVNIVDVGGTVVTVVYQGRTVSLGDPTPFDEELDDGLAIIESIVWADLG